MHLSYKTSRYKGRLYKSYFIAESYREGKKVKKNELWNIGKLSDEQAFMIKQICLVVKNPETALTCIQDIVVQKCKISGSLIIANAFWLEWKFSNAFKYSTNSDISTELVARILTINRCIKTCSHYSIPAWISKTAISEIIGKELQNINDDKIYYELDKIDSNQQHIEDHLFQMTWNKNRSDFDFVNYDITTSYFMGMQCEISDYGISKDEKAHNKQVVLGVMVNDKGYPFKWDVYPGNMSEIETLKENIDACTMRFGLKKINMVFDRGFVSDENLTYIDGHGLKYISALDKDQIPNVPEIDLSVFENVTLDNYATILETRNFVYFDKNLTFKDLGVLFGRRYILGFNPVLFKDERRSREEKMKYFEDFLKNKNIELACARKSRKVDPTRQSVMNELKRLKIKKYYAEPTLKEILVTVQNKKGLPRQVKSYHVTINQKTDILKTAASLDGLCVFVSNNIEQNNGHYLFQAVKIINAYREKTKIEDAFKHIKSFIKLRPFFVHTNEHVRAVYSLSMMAYFINKDLAERRKKIEGIDYLNSKRLYEPFEDYYYTTIKDIKNDKLKNSFMEFSSQTKDYVKKLGIMIK